MFLLEDGNGAGSDTQLVKPRKSDSLIAVLFSAAVIFYIILSLLSVHNANNGTASGSQSSEAAVGSVISPTK